MGGIQSILSMLPGMGLPADLNIDDDVFKGTIDWERISEVLIYSLI